MDPGLDAMHSTADVAARLGSTGYLAPNHLGTTQLDLATAAATLGALVKYREDADRVKQALDRMLTA